MLEQLFTHRRAAPRLRSSPLGPWLGSFVARLSGLGYTPGVCRSYVVLAADLGRWMADHDVAVRELDEAAIEAYVDQRRMQRDRRRAASAHLLVHLRAEGVARRRRVLPDLSPVTPHCQRYAAYMRKERGAAEGTVEGYVAVVREFLVQRFGAGDIDLAALTASDIGDYLVRRAGKLSPKRVAYVATALRSFFRFLFVQGETSTDLAAATLTAQTRHQASVPRTSAPRTSRDCSTPATRARGQGGVIGRSSCSWCASVSVRERWPPSSSTTSDGGRERSLSGGRATSWTASLCCPKWGRRLRCTSPTTAPPMYLLAGCSSACVRPCESSAGEQPSVASCEQVLRKPGCNRPLEAHTCCAIPSAHG